MSLGRGVFVVLVRLRERLEAAALPEGGDQAADEAADAEGGDGVHQDRTGDVRVMQFESEFEWISPSGDGVLTHYMADHYGPGWEMQDAPSVEAAGDIAYDLFQVLKPVAATRNTLLPVGGDYCPPNNWVTELHRWWNARYAWPRFVCGTTRMFLDRVRDELERWRDLATSTASASSDAG